MHPGFREMLCALNAAGVEYLVVGAHALAAHGHVRATKDIDIWVHATPENAERVIEALAAFGAPTHGTFIEDLTIPEFILQIGVAPIRIDILTSIPGVTFIEAWPDRLQTTFAGEPVGVLSKHHLIQNKATVGRPQDLADVDALRRM